MEDSDDFFVECTLCGIYFAGEGSYKQHVKGKKHKQKENIAARQKSTKNAGNSQDSSSNFADINSLRCEECDLQFSGDKPYTQHLKSSVHQKNQQRKKLVSYIQEHDSGAAEAILPKNESDTSLLPEAYAFCKYCDKSFSGPESYSQHIISLAHKKTVQAVKITKCLEQAGKIPEASSKCSTDTKEKGHESLEERFLEELAISEVTIDEDNEIFTCDTCTKSFSGPIPFTQHITSKAHKNKRREIKLLQEALVMSTKESEDDDGVLCCDICKTPFSGPISMIQHMKSNKHLQTVKFRQFKEEMRARGNEESVQKEETDGDHLPKESKPYKAVNFAELSERRHDINSPSGNELYEIASNVMNEKKSIPQAVVVEVSSTEVKSFAKDVKNPQSFYVKTDSSVSFDYTTDDNDSDVKAFGETGEINSSRSDSQTQTKELFTEKLTRAVKKGFNEVIRD